MASFYTYLPLLTQVEGGYTDNPNDNGNWTGGKISVGNLVGTNYGISAPVYSRWLGRTATVEDMKAITPTIAKAIFKAWYWNEVKAGSINDQSVAEIIVDHAVNAGVGAASYLVQKVLVNTFKKSISIDGAIGDQTIAAINSVDPYQLHEAVKEARLAFYENTGQSYWLEGWKKRLSQFVYEKKNIIGIGAGVLAILLIIGYKKLK